MTIANQAWAADAPTATWKRVALAWYLDFLLYSTFATLVSYSVGWAFGMKLGVQLAGFALIRVAFARFAETPGMMLLGIRRDGTRDGLAYQHESWLTMLIGTLFVLDGAKRAVRWTEYARALPAFGMFPDETGQVILSLVWGSGLIAAGCLILRMRASGLLLGLALTAISLASVISSLLYWDEVVAFELIRRRDAQGLPVDWEQIAFMQQILPPLLVAGHCVLLAVLASVGRRFPGGKQ